MLYKVSLTKSSRCTVIGKCWCTTCEGIIAIPLGHSTTSDNRQQASWHLQLGLTYTVQQRQRWPAMT